MQIKLTASAGSLSNPPLKSPDKNCSVRVIMLKEVFICSKQIDLSQFINIQTYFAYVIKG